MWKNVVDPGRPQMTIWRMRFARWMIKAINTEYMILIALSLQQRLQKRASILHTLPTLLAYHVGLWKAGTWC